MILLIWFQRRYVYDLPSVNAFSFSLKNVSDFTVVPSANLIMYGAPVRDDLEAQKLMKSSAVLTLSPTVLSFRRKCFEAVRASYSLPFLINFAPSRVSTEVIKNCILIVSIGSWAWVRMGARERRAMRTEIMIVLEQFFNVFLIHHVISNSQFGRTRMPRRYHVWQRKLSV